MKFYDRVAHARGELTWFKIGGGAMSRKQALYRRWVERVEWGWNNYFTQRDYAVVTSSEQEAERAREVDRESSDHVESEPIT